MDTATTTAWRWRLVGRSGLGPGRDECGFAGGLFRHLKRPPQDFTDSDKKYADGGHAVIANRKFFRDHPPSTFDYRRRVVVRVILHRAMYGFLPCILSSPSPAQSRAFFSSRRITRQHRHARATQCKRTELDLTSQRSAVGLEQGHQLIAATGRVAIELQRCLV